MPGRRLIKQAAGFPLAVLLIICRFTRSSHQLSPSSSDVFCKPLKTRKSFCLYVCTGPSFTEEN